MQKPKVEKPAAKPAVKQQKVKVGTSAKIAEALIKDWPEEAKKIITVMSEAATSRSMQKKLKRVQQALESLGKKGA